MPTFFQLENNLLWYTPLWLQKFTDGTPRSVPKQSNTCDCGIYVLYIGELVQDWETIPTHVTNNDVKEEHIVCLRLRNT